LIYTSSISVYPDLPQTVAEDDADPLHPIYILEQTYFAHFPTTNILRLGGLYGGERHPAKYLAGKTEVAKPHAPINLVSRDKVIYSIQKTIERKIIAETINVVDDEHPSRIEYYTSKCIEMSLLPPHFASDDRLGKLVSSDKWHKLIG
jgi:nucleoside-diphosphate-sugar epimerase